MSLSFALCVHMLRSHRTKVLPTTDIMCKPPRFEVMHFDLYVCVCLPQGFVVHPILQQGYDRCSRITRRET